MTLEMLQKHRKLICTLLLLLTSVIWGAAFVAQSVGMDYVGPWTYVFSRYVLSTLVLLPVTVLADRSASARELPPTSRREYITGGAACGILLGLASISQQAGIQYTTAGKAGFITALYVVLVPVISLFLGRRPDKKIWLCVMLGLAGLYLISVKEGFQIGTGDALVMLCALLFSGQILCVDYFSRRVRNPVKLANYQFFFCMLVNLIGMLLFEEIHFDALRAAAASIIYAGVLSGAVGYTLQIIAQKYTDPAVASLLMSLESVFSVLFGWLILHQLLTGRELIGCGLVFLAVLIAELPFEKWIRSASGRSASR